MDSEIMARIINSIDPVFSFRYGENQFKWFYSFGTLLYYIRDKNMGKKFNGDFDISIIGGEEIDASDFIPNMDQFGFKLKRKILNDVTGKPLNLVFEHNDIKGIGIDVYFWVKGGNYYWHSFAEGFAKHEKYVFKATPALAFKGKLYKYVWEEIALPINIPNLYGTLLDIWYPGWFIPDRDFGYSRAEKTVETKSCKNLEEKLR